MLTAILAAKNIAGENHDLWNVNVERSYHEDFTKEQWKSKKEQGAISPEAAQLSQREISLEKVRD